MNTKLVIFMFLALVASNGCGATIAKLKWLLGGSNMGNTNYYGSNGYGNGGGYGYNYGYPSYSGYNYGSGENVVKVIKVSISPEATYSTGGYNNGYSGYNGGYGGYSGGGGYSYPAPTYPSVVSGVGVGVGVPMVGVSSIGFGTPGYVGGGYGAVPAVYGAGRGFGYGGGYGLGYPGAIR